MIQRAAKAVMPRQDQQESLHQMGWTEAHIQLFQLYRAVYRSGYFQYDSAEYHRLQFARWLYLKGKISG